LKNYFIYVFDNRGWFREFFLASLRSKVLCFIYKVVKVCVCFLPSYKELWNLRTEACICFYNLYVIIFL